MTQRSGSYNQVSKKAWSLGDQLGVSLFVDLVDDLLLVFVEVDGESALAGHIAVRHLADCPRCGGMLLHGVYLLSDQAAEIGRAHV